MTVSRTGISMRELIPRGHTVFHITNDTGAHEMALRALPARLTDRTYALVCATPGHAERAEFSTYTPGLAPLR